MNNELIKKKWESKLLANMKKGNQNKRKNERMTQQLIEDDELNFNLK